MTDDELRRLAEAAPWIGRDGCLRLNVPLRVALAMSGEDADGTANAAYIAAANPAAVLALLDRLRDAEAKGMMRAAEIAEKETAGGLSPYNLRHAVIAIRAAAAAHRGGAGDE